MQDLYERNNNNVILTSALVTTCAPASFAAWLMAKETEPIPPSTYLKNTVKNMIGKDMSFHGQHDLFVSTF